MLLLLRSHLNQQEQGYLRILALERTLDHLIHIHHLIGRETEAWKKRDPFPLLLPQRTWWLSRLAVVF